MACSTLIKMYYSCSSSSDMPLEMDNLVTAMFWTQLLFFSTLEIVPAQFYDSNNYNTFQRHVVNSRSKNGQTRFGYQNPIFAAPTLQPLGESQQQTTSIEESEEYPEVGTSIYLYETAAGNTLDRTRNQDKLSIPTLLDAQTNDFDTHITNTNFGSTQFFQQSILPTASYFNCTTGRVVSHRTGPCIPKARWSATLSTSTTPSWYQFRRTSSSHHTVRFGYQNPILLAPTLPPSDRLPSRPTVFPSTHRPHHTSNKFISFPPTTESTINTESPSPCVQGSRNHRLDPKTNRCYELGSMEPCGDKRNMIFYPNYDKADSIFGECDCISNSTRPLVYHSTTDTCYFVYQQAYCPESQWLIITDDGGATCNHNPCWQYGQMVLNWNWSTNSNTTYMSTTGIVPVYEVKKCVPLGQICHRHSNGSLIFPEPPSNAASNLLYETVLTFLPGSLQPSCNHRGYMNTFLQIPSRNHCRPGSKPHILGQCVFARENIIATNSWNSDALVQEQVGNGGIRFRVNAIQWVIELLLLLCFSTFLNPIIIKHS